MKRNLLYGFILLLSGGMMLTTCQKEYYNLNHLSDEIELYPQLVAPLIYGSMTMSDITELFDSVENIGQFEDSLIYFAYAKDFSVSADTVFEFSDTIETGVIYLESDHDIILPGVPGDTTDPIFRTKALEFELQGENRLDEILIKGGSIGIAISSTFKHEGIMKISSQQILDNFGMPFTETIYIDDPSGNFEFNGTIDTERYTIKPMSVDHSNQIHVDFELELINSGEPILAGDHCSIQFFLFDPGFYHIYGFLDTQDLVDESGSLEIPLWEDNPDLKAITFADPRIEITTASSLGIPFELDLDTLIAVGADGGEVSLVLDGGKTLNFPAPGMDQIGETVTTKIEINNTTSNIDDFLALAPSSIEYRIAGRTSTTGDDTTHFILDDSQLDLSLEFLLPLDFKSSGFALTDTMEFVMGEDGVDTSVVKNAELFISTVNQLPVELRLQILLLDENYLVVDSVFDDSAPLLGASVVDAQSGKLIAATEETNSIVFPAKKLGKLKEVSYMQVEARLTTSGEGDPFVKIYSYYTLDYKVSMLANLRINTREQ